MRPKITYQLVLSLTILVAAFVCLIMGNWCANNLSEISNEAKVFILEDDGITAEEAKKITSINAERREPYSMVFWTQTSSGIVQYPTPETSGVESLRLKEGEAERGLPHANVDGTIRFDRLTIVPSDDATILITEETVAMTLGLKVTMLDFKAIALVSFLGFYLALLFPLALMVIVSLKGIYGNAFSWLSKAFLVLVSAGCVIAAAIIFTYILSEFNTYFPTRWSSSAEWATLSDNFVQSVNYVIAAPLHTYEKEFLQGMYNTLLLAVIAAAGFIVGSCLLRWAIIIEKARYTTMSPTDKDFSETPEIRRQDASS